MKNFFKPLSKRDAIIASVIILAFILWTAVNVVRDLLAGMSFEEIKGEAMFLLFFVIVESGLVTVAFGKEKPKEEDSEGPSGDEQ